MIISNVPLRIESKLFWDCVKVHLVLTGEGTGRYRIKREWLRSATMRKGTAIKLSKAIGIKLEKLLSLKNHPKFNELLSQFTPYKPTRHYKKTEEKEHEEGRKEEERIIARNALKAALDVLDIPEETAVRRYRFGKGRVMVGYNHNEKAYFWRSLKSSCKKLLNDVMTTDMKRLQAVIGDRGHQEDPDVKAVVKARPDAVFYSGYALDTLKVYDISENLRNLAKRFNIKLTDTGRFMAVRTLCRFARRSFAGGLTILLLLQMQSASAQVFA